MNLDCPKVVVITATVGTEYLKQCIESIQNQTYEKIEILIVDDCSTDNSFDILKDISKDDSRIKLYRNNINIGLTKSLNFLLSNCSGKFVARQDSDDISKPDRIKLQIEYLINNDFDVCSTLAIGKQNNKILHKKSNVFPNKLVFKFKNPYIHGTLFSKFDTLQKIGFYDENFYYAQDYKLISDLYKAGYKIGILKIPLYLLNQENNISTLKYKEQKYYANCVKKGISPKIES